MGKRARELRANMYEGDVDLLDDLEEVIKVKNVQRGKTVKQKPITKAAVKEPTNKLSDTPISDKLVACSCNKCGTKVNGIMIHYIYSVVSTDSTGMCTPFVIYECKGCGHNGRRSVLAKAMTPLEFERYYFS